MGVHVKCPFLPRHNHSVNVNAIALFMTRSTLVCFAWVAYKAPLLTGNHSTVRRKKSIFWSDFWQNPPLRRSLSSDRQLNWQLNWQLRTWLIIRQECTIHSTPTPLAVKDMRMYNSHQQILSWPFCKNAFSHSIISVHSDPRPRRSLNLSTLVPRFDGILHWGARAHQFRN